MPVEKRDPVSKAKLFIPTASERSFRQKQRKLDEGLKEVDQMKKDLQKMMKDMKGKK